jgi:hypothetical protein
LPSEANQQAFIDLMKKSEEHSRRGFDILLKRPDFETFFDALAAKGLFAPDQNPKPIAEASGMVRIPFWSALNYLLACATLSTERNDVALAKKVMEVVRAVSTFKADGAVRDNYYTFKRFAEILGAVPLTVIDDADVELASVWLSSSYDQDIVAHTLDKGALTRLLASARPEDWQRAAKILECCLAVKREPGDKPEETEPATIVEAHQLKELISNHSAEFGKKVGHESSRLFRDGVEKVFSQGGRASWSYVFRPAVEDHSQNHAWRGADNSFVEGLRDVLLQWSLTDPKGAEAFVADLLKSDVQMLRRVGVYTLDQRWSAYAKLYDTAVSPSLFDTTNIHEVFNLLAHHFEEFNEQQKMATLEAIRTLPKPKVEDADALLKRIQRRWLSAIENTTYRPAVDWMAALSAELNVGVPDHPEFNSYMEVSHGPGPSAYGIQELIAFSENGTIVEKLNAFKAEHAWRTPTVEGLVENLEQAVIAAPQSFVRVLPTFVTAALPYRHGVINGFKRLWETPKEQHPVGLDWAQTWNVLIGFFDAVLKAPAEAYAGGGLYRPSWLVSVIADMLHSGTRADEHAYSEELLPRAWSLLETLSDRAEGLTEAAQSDPMTAAINTAKGRTIEAIYGHVLRACRLSDEASGSHTQVWEQFRPLFDRELQKAQTSNYEFVTLAGAYMLNLDYLSHEWLSASLRQIFPRDRAAHFASALGGLAYSTPTKSIYVMLRDAGIIAAALRTDLKGRESRKHLIERVMLAYVWDVEKLESPQISYLYENNLVEDLEAASWFLWTIRDENERLTDEQVGKVVAFWDKCVTWAQTQSSPPAKLYASLATLAWALKDASGRSRDLLLAVAPYAAIQHSTHEFLKQLQRLVEKDPVDVSAVVGKLLETYRPTFDYQGRMKALVERLAELDQRPAALDYCDKLRDLEGIRELQNKLRGRG